MSGLYKSGHSSQLKTLPEAGKHHSDLFVKPLKIILRDYPYCEDFFVALGIKVNDAELTIGEFTDTLEEDFLEDCGIDRTSILKHFEAFMQKMHELKVKQSFSVKEITVLGGHNKSGEPEGVSITMVPGEIICIVGPTGSGKSRLLADIECLAQKDTPTGRQILINGGTPAQDKRFSAENKLVAQLSQNMNFIMDVTVEEFLTMHAESRMVQDIDKVVRTIVTCANELAGEKFEMKTPVTSLSGGQSRALMIADTALLSASPVVLIDEIENAGVDRKKAIELLVKKEKIVLMSTHDPILALMGDKRIVIGNGGMNKIIETGRHEKDNLQLLQYIDGKLLELRSILRSGGEIAFDIKNFIDMGGYNS